jgi:hypothetical protein
MQIIFFAKQSSRQAAIFVFLRLLFSGACVSVVVAWK